MPIIERKFEMKPNQKLEFQHTAEHRHRRDFKTLGYTSEDDCLKRCFDGLTFNDIVVFNTTGFSNINWYASNSTDGSPIDPTTTLTAGTYYAFQGEGSCAVGLEVVVEIHNSYNLFYQKLRLWLTVFFSVPRVWVSKKSGMTSMSVLYQKSVAT